MKMKKGATAIGMLFAMIIGLVLLGIMLYMSSEYAYRQPDATLSSILSCRSLKTGQIAECLTVGCDGREGWSNNPVQDSFCRKVDESKPECCVLDEPELWFPEGTILLYWSGTYRDLAKESPFSIGKKHSFSISYVPQGAIDSSLQPKDIKCTLTVNGNAMNEESGRWGAYGDPTNPCYQKANPDRLNQVMLFTGTGAELLEWTRESVGSTLTIRVSGEGGQTEARDILTIK